MDFILWGLGTLIAMIIIVALGFSLILIVSSLTNKG